MLWYTNVGGSASTGGDGAAMPQTEPQVSSADADETNKIEKLEMEDEEDRDDNALHRLSM